MTNNEYRLYAFTANLYLSPLQLGLQTAHLVSEISATVATNDLCVDPYWQWAQADKTIIICGAANHAGVEECWAELQRTATALGLPCAIFHEDEQSLNGAATVCGVVVPKKYWDTKPVKNEDGEIEVWSYIDENWNYTEYPLTHPEGQFIDHIKSFRLAA